MMVEKTCLSHGFKSTQWSLKMEKVQEVQKAQAGRLVTMGDNRRRGYRKGARMGALYLHDLVTNHGSEREEQLVNYRRDGTGTQAGPTAAHAAMEKQR